jgi:hypothetical protein
LEGLGGEWVGFLPQAEFWTGYPVLVRVGLLSVLGVVAWIYFVVGLVLLGFGFGFGVGSVELDEGAGFALPDHGRSSVGVEKWKFKLLRKFAAFG